MHKVIDLIGILWVGCYVYHAKCVSHELRFSCVVGRAFSGGVTAAAGHGLYK